MAHQTSTSLPVPGLTLDLYQKLLHLLQPNTSLANFVVNVSSSPLFDSCRNYVVDSGATDHLCHDQTLFNNLIFPSRAQMVTLPNGHAIPVEGVDTCTLPKHIILLNILFVPQFHFNLQSAPKLTNTNSCIISFFFFRYFFLGPKINEADWIM